MMSERIYYAAGRYITVEYEVGNGYVVYVDGIPKSRAYAERSDAESVQEVYAADYTRRGTE